MSKCGLGIQNYILDNEKQSLLEENKIHKQYGNNDSETLPSCVIRKSIKLVVRETPETPADESINSPLEDDVFISTANSSSSGVNKRNLMLKDCFFYTKMVVLVFIWIGCCFVMMTKGVKVKNVHQLSIANGTVRDYLVPEPFKHNQILLTLEGAMLPPYYANLSDNSMSVWIQIVIVAKKPKTLNLRHLHPLAIQNISETRRIPLVSEKLIGVVPEVKREEYFELNRADCDIPEHCYLRINMKTSLTSNFPISLTYDTEPIDKDIGIIYAACILAFLYLLIMFEIVHKTVASIIASTMSIAVLAALNARPTIAELTSWIDIETLLLLFSMMVLVAILGETGIFDFLAVLAFKITKGNVWPLINTLCVFTTILSCFLDNVTTALLMTPVTIRLCEMMRINPVPVLISMIIFANIGGALTPIGDPPNVIIASNSVVKAAGVDFSLFTLHMGVGGILCLIVAYVQLRAMYNTNGFKFDEPSEVQDLKREIQFWKRAAASMTSYSKEENVVKTSLMETTSNLLGKLNDKTGNRSPPEQERTISIKDLEKQYCIRDKVLLIKSSITLGFVICTFFLHSLPEIKNLGLAWTALLGVLLLLILSGCEDIEAILAKVEWGTLLFFASLFTLMEALSQLGLIGWVGNQVENIIKSVGQESRLAVAILIILWVSAVASAFVDNIPLTTMMIKIAITLAENRELELPLQPLIWALAFGACLGGNGTLFGSSCNIVCACVAEQHGHKLPFMHFMKISAPVTVVTLCVATIYLLIVHVVWIWH